MSGAAHDPFTASAGHALERAVSERLRVEAELAAIRAESDQRRRLYETIISSTPDLVYVFDLNYRFTFANEALLQMWGRTLEHSIGRGLRELGYEEWHAAMHEREIDQVIATKRPIRGEVAFPHAVLGRRSYDYIFVPVLDQHGEVEAIVGTTRDITERTRAEEELRASEERLRAFVVASSDVVYRMSADWSEMRFLEGRDFIADTREPSRSWLDKYIHPDDHAFVMGAVADAVRRRKTFELEHRVQRIDGTIGWTFSRAIPLVDEKGEVVEWFGIASDVTERKAAEAEREQLLAAERRARATAEDERERATEANRAKSDFLAAMSHELRTPLNAIAGHAELMELGIHGPLTDAQREALGRIQRSEQHLLSLINDVLNFAKLEAGRVEYDMTDLVLEPVVRTVMQMVEPQFAARTLTHEVCVRGDLAVRADGEKLQQILLNLLSNAIKFTNPGGRVTVSASVDDADRMVQLRVSDTGVGIPSEKQASIFEPFVQVHRNLTRTTEGTGLGLAISRDLALGMDGELHVESTEGEGATFTLALPQVTN